MNLINALVSEVISEPRFCSDTDPKTDETIEWYEVDVISIDISGIRQKETLVLPTEEDAKNVRAGHEFLH